MASSPQFFNFLFHILFTLILGYGEAAKYGRTTVKCDTGKTQQVNPSDPYSFIKCNAAGKPIVFNCPPETWFHPKLEVCVWERDYPIDGLGNDGGKQKGGQSSKGGKGNGGNGSGGGKGNGSSGGNGYTGQSSGGKGNGGQVSSGGQFGNEGDAIGNGIRGPDYGVYPDSYEGTIEDDEGDHGGQGLSGGFSNGGGYGSLGGNMGGTSGGTYGGDDVENSQIGEYDIDIRSHKIVRRALDEMSGLQNGNTTYFLNDNDLQKKHLDYEISEITSNHIGGDIIADDKSFKLTNITTRQNPGNNRFPLGNRPVSNNRQGNRPVSNNRQGNRRPINNGNFNIFRPNSAGGPSNQRPNNNGYGNFDRPNNPNGNFNDRPFDNGNNNMANYGNGNMDNTNNNDNGNMDNTNNNDNGNMDNTSNENGNRDNENNNDNEENNNSNDNDNDENDRPTPNAPCSMSGPLHTQYFQDPEDCSNYYTCNHGRMVLTFCPRGLYYIPDRTRCEDWVPGGCEQKQHESPGVTPVNETDETEK